MKNKSLLIACVSLLGIGLIFCLFTFTKSRIRYVLIQPSSVEIFTKDEKSPVDLVFYFHGAGTTVFESFSLGGLNLSKAINEYRKDLVFVSFGYDDNYHWSSPQIIHDTIKMIHTVSKKFNVRKIVFIGVSMGGTLALDVLSLADKELRDKVTDVLAVFPIIDYQYTLLNTKRPNISFYLKKHFTEYKDPEEQMRLSSPITYVSQIPSHTKITLIEGIHDTHVCSNQIEKYYKEIKKINENNELLKWDIDHTLEKVSKEFGDLIKEVLI